MRRQCRQVLKGIHSLGYIQGISSCEVLLHCSAEIILTRSLRSLQHAQMGVSFRRNTWMRNLLPFILPFRYECTLKYHQRLLQLMPSIPRDFTHTSKLNVPGKCFWKSRRTCCRMTPAILVKSLGKFPKEGLQTNYLSEAGRPIWTSK